MKEVFFHFLMKVLYLAHFCPQVAMSLMLPCDCFVMLVFDVLCAMDVSMCVWNVWLNCLSSIVLLTLCY